MSGINGPCFRCKESRRTSSAGRWRKRGSKGRARDTVDPEDRGASARYRAANLTQEETLSSNSKSDQNVAEDLLWWNGM